MDIPETLLSTTIGAAVNFIFTELQGLLKEIRSRSKREKPKEQQPQKTENKAAKRDEVVRWALKAKIDSQTESEIKGLIEIIEIYKQGRLRSRRIIAKMGGETFASPPQIAALNDAEESIEKLSKELIGKIEKLYGAKISVDLD